MGLNNKVILIGHLGADPETRRLNSGDSVVNMRIATSDSWRDKNTGERKEKTEWHNVVIFNQNLVKVAEQYLKKGSHVAIEGKLTTRSWEKEGEKRYTTEVVLENFNGELKMLDKKDGDGDGGGRGRSSGGGRDSGGSGGGGRDYGSESGGSSSRRSSQLDDEIPF